MNKNKAVSPSHSTDVDGYVRVPSFLERRGSLDWSMAPAFSLLPQSGWLFLLENSPLCGCVTVGRCCGKKTEEDGMRDVLL